MRAAQAAASPAPDAARGPGGFIGALGFGQLHFMPPPFSTSALAVATSRPECTADLQLLATTALAQLGAAANAYAAGTMPLPEVTGVSVTPHGDPSGAWYFAIGPNIPRDLFPRPAGGGTGGNNGTRAPRPGGFGDDGGPPPVFQSQITVEPNGNANAAPRPVLTPSPALIAELQPFKALISCAYATVLTPDDAKARGFDIPAPGARPAAPPSPAPGASAAPRNPRAQGPGFIQYAPAPGLFVVRVPELGTGGGSVKQP